MHKILFCKKKWNIFYAPNVTNIYLWVFLIIAPSCFTLLLILQATLHIMCSTNNVYILYLRGFLFGIIDVHVHLLNCYSFRNSKLWKTVLQSYSTHSSNISWPLTQTLRVRKHTLRRLLGLTIVFKTDLIIMQ